MTFADSITTCFQKYKDFHGRATRSEYWWFFLFIILCSTAGSVVGLISETLGAMVSLIIYIAILLPTIAVTTRRLHDTNRSGWLQLIALIPIVGLVLFYFLFQDSKEPNRFGATDTTDSEKNEPEYVFINENNGKPVDLTQTTADFCKNYQGVKSKNVWCFDEISPEQIEKHKKAYLNLSQGEKPLVLLNKGTMIGSVFTGLMVTNTCIHFCTLKKSFFASLIPWFLKGAKGKAKISGLDSLEIAEHDACFGTAYVGHELRINDEILGYVRMGTNMTLDEDAIGFLNGLFNHFAKNNLIKREVGEYNWQ